MSAMRILLALLIAFAAVAEEPRPYVVTNVQDEGGGSLRQAILDVNALCPIPERCAIVFQIPAPVPASGWFTIQPRTPLPEISGAVLIDGATQTLFTGDTNGAGPELEINGALVVEQSGLRFRPNCDLAIRNLAVNGFPGYGIEIESHATHACFVGGLVPMTVEIEQNYLGTDPRGRTAKPNQRGLGVFTLDSHVAGNLISGNERSGIYVQGGVLSEIVGNRIGVASDGSPLGNGAGIFLDLGAPTANDPGADVMENVIAYNRGMAIARTFRGEMLISRNSIFDNLQQGIDAGIDGMTPQRANDFDVPNAPVLFSASYDPVQHTTTIRGRIDSVMNAYTRSIEVYESLHLSGWSTPQAERSVAIAAIPSGHQEFEIVVPEDLRGRWVTATYSITHNPDYARAGPRGIGAQSHRLGRPGDTSELSQAITVQ
jgi:hypothetical protein